jgi:hypothetical protein
MTNMAKSSDSPLNLAQHRVRRPAPGTELVKPMASLVLLGTLGWVLVRFGRRSPAGWLVGTAGGWLLARAARGIARHLEHRVASAAGRKDPVAQASEASFPASDPPSWSPTRAGAPM